MTMRFKLEGCPDDLEPGDYATTIESAYWEGDDLVVNLRYVGPLVNKDDCLFPIRKKLTKGGDAE